MSLAWFDGVSLTAEAALSAATGSYGVWDSSLWNTGTWGPDVTWVDISAYLRSLSTSRKFSRDIQVWEAGTAQAALNNRDGRFSPSNMSSPYVTGGVTGIRPWRPVRYRAAYAGITYDLYRGYVPSWQEVWTAGHADAEVTISCVDELARLAAFDGLEQAPVGAGETSGRRIHRILDNAGHVGERSIDDGRTTMQATTLAGDAVTELKVTTDSEGGALWIDADGSVDFDNGYALIENTRSNTVQATYADTASSGLPFSDATIEYNGDLLANIAAFSSVGGTAQVATDLTSRALYGDRRTSRTDLVCEADAQVSALAQLWVARFKDPELRVTQIQIKPRADPTRLFPQVLGRKVRDLVRVVVRPLGGYTITRDCFISGISHDITDDDWTTTFDLSSAVPFTQFTTSRFDVGVWDSATWFY